MPTFRQFARYCRRFPETTSWMRPLRRGRRRRLARQRGHGVQLASAEVLEDRTMLTTLTVTTTADVVDANDGVVSLREALAADEVAFNIPANDPGHVYYKNDGVAGRVSRNQIATTTEANDANIADIDPDWPHSWYTIKPTFQLSIFHTTHVNGYTQPGASANTNTADSGLGLNSVLRIEIDASGNMGAAHGLNLDQGANTTISGLVINGIKSTQSHIFAGANAPTPSVTGNFLGTDVSGTVALGGVSHGVHITHQGGTGGFVGGDTPAERNLIAGGQYGVYVRETHGVQIQGNMFGTDRSGTDVVRLTYGVYLFGANDTLIGGVVPNVRNVISTGSGFGIFISTSQSENTRIQGNYLGTDVSGKLALGNGIGISERGAGTIIGGGDADDGQLDGIVAARNIIAASPTSVGIDLLAIQSGATVQGNYVGTDVTGTVALGNFFGIRLGHSSAGTVHNQVGGAGPGEGNVIAGNTYGIWMQHQSTRGNRVEGNWIGVASDGSPLGNANDGIFYRPAYFSTVPTPEVNTFGGTAAGEGNVIAYNGRSGIRIDSNASPAQQPKAVLSILGNSIHSNGALGIDLLQRDAVNNPLAGVTDNDIDDADDGPNFTQNYPVLTTVTAASGSTHVEGTLNSTPDTIFRVEFFSSSAADPSGFGEGEHYLGFTELTTDADGDAVFAADLPVEVSAGHVITSTATRLFDHDGLPGTPLVPGESSEFSGTLVVPVSQLPDLEVVSFTVPAEIYLDQPISGLTYRVRNNGPAPFQGNLPFLSHKVFYISTDPTITTDDHQLVIPPNDVFLPSLGSITINPGEEMEFGVQPLIVSSAGLNPALLGNVYIGALLDGDNTFAETDETNNASVGQPIHVCVGDVIVDTSTDQSILDALTHVCGSVIVDSIAGLTSVSLPNLETIDGKLIVTNNPELVELNLPLLDEVVGTIDISNNTLLQGVELPTLNSAGSVGVVSNDSAGTISLGNLGSVGGDVELSDNDSAGTIGLGGLGTVGGSVNVTGNDNAGMIGLDILQSVGGSLVVDDNGEPTLDFSGATTNVAGDARFGDASIVLDDARLNVAGTLTLSDGAILAIDPNSIVSADFAEVQQGSTVQGSGAVAANSTVSYGAVLPGTSPGKLTFDGNFEQRPGGTLVIEIGGSTAITEYDVFAVTGNATFTGTIEFVLTGGFSPQPGDTFEPLLVGGNLDLTDANIVLPAGLHFYGGTVVAPPSDGVLLVEDPAYPGQSILIVGGTSGNDKIEFKSKEHGTKIEVKLGSRKLGRYDTKYLSRLVAFGGEGNDRIKVSDKIAVTAELHGGDGRDRLQAGVGPAMLFGGEGNDRLHGSRAGDILVGGSGNDIIIGGFGRDFIIGGDGSDLLFGGHGDDLMIAGLTSYDANRIALQRIQDEWNSNRDYETRIKNIRGVDNDDFDDRKNGGYFLKAAGDYATVFNDGALDIVFGGLGRDWFFEDASGPGWSDWLLDRRKNEYVERVR